VKSQIESLNEHVDVELLVLPGLRGIWPYIGAISTLKKELKKDYDIIHVHFGHVSTLVKLVYRGTKPIITSYFGSDLYGNVSNSALTNIKGSFIKRLNKYFAHIDAHSIVKTDRLGALIARNGTPVSTIPNGVDIVKFNIQDKEKCRNELGLTLDKRIILFPADPSNKVKNFSLLQSALSAIDSSLYELVSFDGGDFPHDKVPMYLNAADLVVCTSIHEGSPNVIKEAMACNCTIYSTDVGDVEQLLEDVRRSKILSYNVADWSNAIGEFLSESALDSNSREELERKNLDEASIALRILKVYESVVKSS